MSILIDGYNLLHVTGIFGKGIGPGTLERSRGALLNFLAASVDPRELPHTAVVFDAKDAPPGLPREIDHRGLRVYYAAAHNEADDLIEELILADSAPRRLTVVSSDHRLQRAARRRRAKAIDSDKWYAQLIDQRRRDQPGPPDEAKPQGPLSAEEVQRWLGEFSDISLEELEAEQQGLDNPFPPGYGEDLLEDEGKEKE